MTLAEAVAELTPRQARDALRAWHQWPRRSFENEWACCPLARAYGPRGALWRALIGFPVVYKTDDQLRARAAELLGISPSAVRWIVSAYDVGVCPADLRSTDQPFHRLDLRALLRARAREAA